MEIIKTKAAMRAYSEKHGPETGFVATMGYLHEGHLTLVRRALAENARVVVSIFVNPAQFNDPADLEKYPVDLERDTAMLEKEGVHAVFVPARSEVFPEGLPALRLRYEAIMGRLCGRFRPGHFEGVLLIVHNLFQWVRPARAYFGLKDYQQCLLIRKMALDMELSVDVISCPLIREADGLAMSSRNVRLSDIARRQALKISQALFQAEKEIRMGAKTPLQVSALLAVSLQPLEVEYAAVYDAATLAELTDWKGQSGVLVAVAAYVEGVRLIDNIIIS